MRSRTMLLVMGALLGLFLTSIPATAQPSLVAYYPFNDNADDASGNEHNGAVSGATLGQDRFGNPNSAYCFSASGDCITVPQSPALYPDSGIIVEAWVYPTEYPSSEQYGQHYMIVGPGRGYDLSILSDSTVNFRIEVPGTWETVTSLTPIPLNQWTFLRGEASFSTGTMKFFIDGVLQGTKQLSITSWINTDWDIKLGCHGWEGISSFRGCIDDIRIWNWSESSVKAYYPFNGDANDFSGRGHDGVDSGAVLGQDRLGNPNSAYCFDGVNDFITVGPSLDFAPDSGIIIDLWIQPTAYPDLVGTGWEYHKTILSTTTDAYGFQMALYSDSLVGFGIAPYPWVIVYSQTKIPLNTWTHLRGTYQRSTGTIQLFVNDVLEGETVSASTGLGNTGFVIGKNPLSWMPDHPHAFAGCIDEIRISDWSPDAVSDSIIIGQPDCLVSVDHNKLVIPIYLNNHDTVKAMDIPLQYDWPFDPDSISYVGTRAQDLDVKIRSIDTVNKKIRIALIADNSGSGLVLPPVDGVTANIPIARIMFHLPYQCSQEMIGAPDTCTLVLPGENVQSLKVVDNHDVGYVPALDRDATKVLRYKPGDCNGDDNVDISDAVCLISYIFSGGTPACLLAGDSNGDASTDISDVVYLIAYIFSGGLMPGTSLLCDYQVPLAKAIPSVAELTTFVGTGGEVATMRLGISTLVETKGIQLEFETSGNVTVTDVRSNIEGMGVFSGTVDGRFRVGMLDMTGKASIPAGQHDVVMISYQGDGQIELESAIVVGEDAGKMNVTIKSVGSGSPNGALPSVFALSQNMPNPFNPTTEISFSVPQATEVKLEVLNILGQSVRTLVDEFKAAGSYSVTWDSRDNNYRGVASGIYLYRITAGEFTDTRKMILMK